MLLFIILFDFMSVLLKVAIFTYNYVWKLEIRIAQIITIYSMKLLRSRAKHILVLVYFVKKEPDKCNT